MSLLDDVLTSARVTAVKPARLLRLPRARFEQLIGSDDKLAVKIYRSFCRQLSDRLRKTNEALAARSALDATLG
jgi:CRP-like cAMP-binding protein